jgi:hypothetical protein
MGLLDSGVRLEPAGKAKRRPSMLFDAGYMPHHRIDLFDTTYYLSNLRVDANFRFFVSYVRLASRPRVIYPRIFYKDSSLIWRSPSHFIRSATENWVGKGDLKPVRENGRIEYYTAEETTNLPFEIQHALDIASRRARRVPRDERAVPLVLRKAPPDRIEPYDDFAGPRRRARIANKRALINGGKPVAYFEDKHDPASLVFVRGFEPDFSGRGIIEMDVSMSRMYGGEVRKYRILSKNRLIQYQFVAAPRHVWIVPPQTLTTEIMSYGVRTLDVDAADDLCIPGYEYHYLDEWAEPPEMYSQIPNGFAGALSEVDPSRADASPWNERMPVVKEFRRRVRLPWKSPLGRINNGRAPRRARSTA